MVPFGMIGCAMQNQAMDYAKKVAPYANTDDNIPPTNNRIASDFFFEKRAEDLYFVMERVQPGHTMNFWHTFSDKNNEAVSNLSDLSDQKNQGIAHAAKLFSNILQKKDLSKDELWIAYVSVEPVHKAGEVAYNNIEMVMTVSTAEDLPFTTHMAIHCALLFDKQSHNRISLALHAFAARAMKDLHPEKVYMITRPMKKMRELLIDAFKHNKGALSIGDNIWRNSLSLNNVKDAQLLAMREQYPNYIEIEDHSKNMAILNKEGNRISYLNSQRAADWFCCETTVELPYLAIDINALVN